MWRSYRAWAGLALLGLAGGCAEGETVGRGRARPTEEPPEETDGEPAPTKAEAAPAPSAPTPPPAEAAPPGPELDTDAGPCTAIAKSCGGVCVLPSPKVGCGLDDCTPCPAPSAGKASVCNAGTCEEVADDSGAPVVDAARRDTGPTDVDRCLALTTNDSCTQCVCTSCTQQSLACGASGNVARDTGCTQIVDCGRTSHCTSIACYCGTADLTACQTGPLGACASVIQGVVGSTDFNTVAGALADPNHAVYLADQVGQCAQANCAAICGL